MIQRIPLRQRSKPPSEIVALMKGKRFVVRYQIGLQLGLYGRAVAIHSPLFVRKGSHYHLA
jgi:hypothetical protein